MCGWCGNVALWWLCTLRCVGCCGGGWGVVYWTRRLRVVCLVVCSVGWGSGVCFVCCTGADPVFSAMFRVMWVGLFCGWTLWLGWWVGVCDCYW